MLEHLTYIFDATRRLNSVIIFYFRFRVLVLVFVFRFLLILGLFALVGFHDVGIYFLYSILVFGFHCTI